MNLDSIYLKSDKKEDKKWKKRSGVGEMTKNKLRQYVVSMSRKINMNQFKIIISLASLFVSRFSTCEKQDQFCLHTRF